MFTLQSRLLENAGGSSMAKSIGNCAAPLVHRGPQSNRYVGSQTYKPVQNVSWRGGDYTDRSITINIPPWQNVPFEPMPFLDMPQWYPYEYSPPYHSGEPDPFGGDWAWTVSGDTLLGDTYVTNMHSNNQFVAGDIYFNGVPMRRRTETFVTSVRLDGGSLVATTRTYRFVGRPLRGQEKELVLC